MKIMSADDKDGGLIVKTDCALLFVAVAIINQHLSASLLPNSSTLEPMDSGARVSSI